jgi:hypothetical protein
MKVRRSRCTGTPENEAALVTVPMGGVPTPVLRVTGRGLDHSGQRRGDHLRLTRIPFLGISFDID